MKNFDKSQRKKCIIISLKDFKEDVKKAFGEEYEVVCSPEGIKIGHNDGEFIVAPMFDIQKYLSKYYDVRVESVHIDGLVLTSVWVVYL